MIADGCLDVDRRKNLADLEDRDPQSSPPRVLSVSTHYYHITTTTTATSKYHVREARKVRMVGQVQVRLSFPLRWEFQR